MFKNLAHYAIHKNEMLSKLVYILSLVRMEIEIASAFNSGELN